MMCGPATLLSYFSLMTLASATWLPDSRNSDVPCHEESAIESRATTTQMTNGSSLLFGKVGNMTWGVSGKS